MASGFPLQVNGLLIPSSEALYQAMRFPGHPEIQREILAEPNPMKAKMLSKKGGRRRQLTRHDWDDVRIDIMHWCLHVKLIHHFVPLYRVFLATESLPIVEWSHRDRFWGAVQVSPGQLQGQNVLGRLLTEIRDRVVDWMSREGDDEWPAVAPPPIDDCRLLNVPIRVVTGE